VSRGTLAVIVDVRFSTQDVGDFFLRARRDCLVVLQLGDGRLIRTRNVVRGVLEVVRHGASFSR
jgi:hypothetical protein